MMNPFDSVETSTNQPSASVRPSFCRLSFRAMSCGGTILRARHSFSATSVE